MDRLIDDEVERIRTEMRNQDRTQADLGRLLGLDSSQVTRIFSGKRKLQIHEHRKIAEWLALTPEVAGSASAAVVAMPGLIPLYGLVGASSESRLTFAEQNLRGYVPMHPNQLNVRKPFALEVADVSMSPRYEPGEIVYLAPHRFPLAGQDCVIVTESGEGLLKQFVKRAGGFITLRQLNPPKEFQLAADDVIALHAVVGRG
jgi:phage repressor protein C with HTH and peptisase S24 domain